MFTRNQAPRPRNHENQNECKKRPNDLNDKNGVLRRVVRQKLRNRKQLKAYMDRVEQLDKLDNMMNKETHTMRD